MPDGMSCVSPGFSSSGASMQARKSTPAEPCVAYCGSGYSRPMRGSRMGTSSRRRAPVACAPSAGMSGTLGLRSERAGLVARLITLGDDFDQLPCQGQLARECELALAAAGPVDRQCVLVLVERQPLADLVGCDHVEVLAGQFGERVALDVLGFGRETDQERWRLGARDRREHVGSACQRQTHRVARLLDLLVGDLVRAVIGNRGRGDEDVRADEIAAYGFE